MEPISSARACRASGKVRRKGSAMTHSAKPQATKADTVLTRRDVMRLLGEVGNPAQLDVSGQDLQGIELVNCDLRGSNLSQAQVGEANLCGAHLAQADLHA